MSKLIYFWAYVRAFMYVMYCLVLGGLLAQLLPLWLILFLTLLTGTIWIGGAIVRQQKRKEHEDRTY